MAKYNYLDAATKTFLPITSRVYAVEFSRAALNAVPALGDHEFIIHRGEASKKFRVTHVLTGTSIGMGKTLGEAIDNAESLLITAGNKNFIKAVQQNLDKYGSADK